VLELPLRQAAAADPVERDAKLDLVRDLLVGSLGDVASTGVV